MDTQPAVLLTADGSSTVSAGGLTYHSSHGAVQESQHVFIEAGLKQVMTKHAPGTVLAVFEMGFGSGLNALLTALTAAGAGMTVRYTSIEKHPLPPEVWQSLNYGEHLSAAALFKSIHEAAWDQEASITPNFVLKKVSGDLDTFLKAPGGPYHLIYFDAFAPDDHPALWTPEIFTQLAAAMLPGGILTTYCAKGQVRRNMLAAGLQVERLPGPPGKREMMRAEKR